MGKVVNSLMAGITVMRAFSWGCGQRQCGFSSGTGEEVLVNLPITDNFVLQKNFPSGW